MDIQTRNCQYVVLATFASLVASTAQGVDFNREVRPLLVKKCFACHGPDEEHREAGLRLDDRAVAISALPSGKRAIVPGDGASSELIARVTSQDADAKMPPAHTGITLTSANIETLRAWIIEGASYAPHWSFTAPTQPVIPIVQRPDWALTTIDRFVLAQQERTGLSPNPPADRFEIIRRLSFDLRGLPPTPEEVRAFLEDSDPGAYERLVDRLLADPAFGERWARMWLDLARYADSSGYGSDPLRVIWRYRDWVIDAFNRNAPFDEFTIEQIAGDLLPSPSEEQLVATAFHRNTMTNTEGGTDDEEFRVAAVKDRVNTTMQVWMGLTMGCAQCHTHKYDPITHREYYQFFAIFNQTADTDKPTEEPTIQSLGFDHAVNLARINTRLTSLRDRFNAVTPESLAAQTQWEESLRPKVEWRPVSASKVPGSSTSAATWKLEFSATKATAVRLSVIALQGDTLSGLRISPSAEPPAAAPSGRYVRVTAPGNGRYLSLAEVEVYGQEGANVARDGKASQSSTAFGASAIRAIDGLTSGEFFDKKSVTHTNAENNPWWEVDLGATRPIERIAIWNRTDGDTGARLANYNVSILDDKRNLVWQETRESAPNPTHEFAVSGSHIRLVADLYSEVTSEENAKGLLSLDPSSGWKVKSASEANFVVVFAPQAGLPEASNWTLSLQGERSLESVNIELEYTEDAVFEPRLKANPEILEILNRPRDARTADQNGKVAETFRSLDPAKAAIRDEIRQVEASIPPTPVIPVMKELPGADARPTFVMVKGNFLNRGDEVRSLLPTAFSQGASEPVNRLQMAKWLVSPRNPLTARVAVNRFWGQIFGEGIVETEEDFGIQGEPPSHPELLDFLATEFVRLDWDIKQLLREIVLSNTYRQASVVTPERLAKDPKNRWFTRGARVRLEAEMVRDQALSIAGLLSHKLRGPSVFPPQPEGLWQAAFNGERTWKTSQGEDRYRRGIYTFWRRTIPYPSMATFDAPSRETCALRRTRTNTPLQAFVTLNDPVFVEAAQSFARRILREGGQNQEERARFAIEVCLSRPASPEQVTTVSQLVERERKTFQDNRENAIALASEPLGPLPAEMDPVEAAAWTVVANVLLNTDGTLVK